MGASRLFVSLSVVSCRTLLNVADLLSVLQELHFLTPLHFLSTRFHSYVSGVTKAVGSVGLSLILWVVCGFINILSALTYLELGAMLPSAGGEYQFVSEAMGTKVAFLIVWANIFIRPASNSVIARTTGQYLLAQFFPECSTPTAVVTVFAIWLWCKYIMIIMIMLITIIIIIIIIMIMIMIMIIIMIVIK